MLYLFTKIGKQEAAAITMNMARRPHRGARVSLA